MGHQFIVLFREIGVLRNGGTSLVPHHHHSHGGGGSAIEGILAGRYLIQNDCIAREDGES